MFRLYVRQEGSEYDFEHPVMIAPASLEMITEIPCARIRLAVPGRYYAVVTAWRLDGEFESEPSNEVEFIYNGIVPFPPAPPPPPSDGPPPLPVPPPPPPLPAAPKTTAACGAKAPRSRRGHYGQLHMERNLPMMKRLLLMIAIGTLILGCAPTQWVNPYKLPDEALRDEGRV